jgi:hypothetical protein
VDLTIGQGHLIRTNDGRCQSVQAEVRQKDFFGSLDAIL